jgi:hypothetical protein
MIPRQDGKTGTSYATKSVDGRDVFVTADGRIEERNRVIEYDAQGRVKRATGDLKWLDRLRKQSEAFATPMPVIALPGIPSPCDIRLGVTEEAWPGLVKLALHFIAGFVEDVAISDELRRIVLGNETPPEGDYLRSIAWDAALFGEEQPPRHEVTAYPGARVTYVTLMLFGVFTFVTRLPGVSARTAVRYRQAFDKSPPLLLEVAPATIDWENPLGTVEKSDFLSGMFNRMNSIGLTFKQREHEDMCIAAARRAMEATRKMSIGFIDAFRAELQCYSWPNERIDEAVDQTKSLLQNKMYPWEFPFTAERGPGWTRPWVREDAS